MAKNHHNKHPNQPRVTATCAVCGATRRVRAPLIEGFTALACASHHASAGEAGVHPADGQGVVVSFNVAGYFTGFQLTELTPAMRRSAHRAAGIAAAAQGRPAPPPDFDPADTSWVDKRLLDALGDALGPNGWEIADYVRHGKAFEAKVYTDWGWAGFVAGTAEEIASLLAETRSESRRAAEGLRCPTCAEALDPFGATIQCGCGTVVWTPPCWPSPFASVSDLVAYLDDTPSGEDLHALVAVHALYHSWGDWSCAEDFAALAWALNALVVPAKFICVHDRVIGAIPLGARVVPGAAGALIETAEQFGYELVVQQRFGTPDLIEGWFGATEDTPEELPDRFRFNGTELEAAGAPLEPPDIAGVSDYDRCELWERVCEEIEGETASGVGVMVSWCWGEFEALPTVFIEAADLGAGLREAGVALAQLTQRCVSRYRDLAREQSDTP